MPAIWDHFSATNGVALLAGWISLLGLVISKEQKISEFRQSWIDELRKDVASIISNANATFNLFDVQPAEKTDMRDMWKQGGDKAVEMSLAIARVRLRLNPREAPSRLVLESIQRLEEYFNQGGIKKGFTSLQEIEIALLHSTGEVLKEEWIRVRKGERFYRFTLCFLSILFVFVVVLTVVFGLRSFVHQLK